jgi:lipoate-protein ligase B
MTRANGSMGQFACLKLRFLGLLRYADALQIMDETHEAVRATAMLGEGEILVVEHPPVVTMGNRFVPTDMILNEDALRARGIDFHKIDRGGSVTIHEPGQVVVYPIVKLDRARLGPKAFVNALEESMISLCAEYGILASRDSVNPGVWVGGDKIGAIGIRISQGVTKHGLAFNATNNLSTFSAVVPCGIRGRGVTSLALSLARTKAIASSEGGDSYLDSLEVAKRLAENVQTNLLRLASEMG